MIKFDTRKQGIWLGADYHYNHSPKWEIPIWKDRGFSSVEEMNEYIIRITNEKVKENDLFFTE